MVLFNLSYILLYDYFNIVLFEMNKWNIIL